MPVLAQGSFRFSHSWALDVIHHTLVTLKATEETADGISFIPLGKFTRKSTES